MKDLGMFNRAFSVRFFEGFLVTLRREWSGIDHLRLDKFYLCIRRFVKAVFGLVSRCGWDLELLREFVEVLEVSGFFAEDRVLGNGVVYHVVGVFVEELRGCFVKVEKEVVDLLFRPFFRVLAEGVDKILIGKVRGLVFEELLKIGTGLLDRKIGGGGGDEGYDDVAFGLIALRMGFAARFYEIGSSVECVQGNRKVVLKLHEEFLKLERRFEASGIEIEVPDVVRENDDDDEEVPELIPIDGSEKNGEDSGFDANGEAEEAEDMLDDVEDARKHKKARKEVDGHVKKSKIKKKKEKKNRSLDENFSVPETCAPVTDNLVEPTLTQESKSSSKKRKKKEMTNKSVDTNESEALLSAPVDSVLVNKSSSTSEKESNGNVLNESVIANLQKQFENVAAELVSDDENDDDFSLNDAFLSIGEKLPIRDKSTIKKKKNKKRAKSCDPQNSINEVDSGVNGAKSLDTSAKKVRFAMKNNLVWKPHSPLPPQSLRIPPSVTPRGSALKKGVLPGPIREIPPAKKKKLKKNAKKILMKSVPWR
ncbi:hypothetical protein Leryth_011796 [Lithospermum erythrorhizon]|nr:hypothetical protein Leryth_011796 [Lithospermum erythrorhizon]